MVLQSKFCSYNL